MSISYVLSLSLSPSCSDRKQEDDDDDDDESESQTLCTQKPDLARLFWQTKNLLLNAGDAASRWLLN